ARPGGTVHLPREHGGRHPAERDHRGRAHGPPGRRDAAGDAHRHRAAARLPDAVRRLPLGVFNNTCCEPLAHNRYWGFVRTTAARVLNHSWCEPMAHTMNGGFVRGPLAGELLAAEVLAKGGEDGQRGEVGIEQAEIVPGLVAPARVGPLEVPYEAALQPGPLVADALEGAHRVAGLLRLAHAAGHGVAGEVAQ